MEHERVHRFELDVESHRQVCKCGKRILDAVHQVNIVRGVATPTVVKKPNPWG